MRFLLSIHDIWPGNYLEVAENLTRLRRIKKAPIALLVVPKYHDQMPIQDHDDFIHWIKSESELGSEIFLHGYRHLMPEKVEGEEFKGRRTAWGKWINKKWVNEEAEFCGLDSETSGKLLGLGCEAFKSLMKKENQNRSQIQSQNKNEMIPLAGFVAPTWHGAPSILQLKNQDIVIFEKRFSIHHLKSGQKVFAPPIAWNFDKENSLFGGNLWLKIAQALPLIKIALHPPDFHSEETWKTLEKILHSGEGAAYRTLFKQL